MSKSGWIKAIGWTAAAVGAAHVVAGTWIIGSIAFPNPKLRFRTWGTLRDFGLDGKAEDVKLSEGSKAWFFGGAEGPTAVIVCHGRSRNRSWMLPVIKRLVDDFAVLAFDFPNHGKNGVGTTTIGLRESRSVHAAIDFLEERGYKRVLIFGVSMGGVATLLALGGRARESVVGVALDGVFDDLKSLLDTAAASMMTPEYLQRLSVRMAEQLAGYRVEAVRPVDAIARVDLPILVAHGAHDELIPRLCASKLVDAAAGPAREFIYDGGHDEMENSELHDEVLHFFRDLEREAGA